MKKRRQCWARNMAAANAAVIRSPISQELISIIVASGWRFGRSYVATVKPASGISKMTQSDWGKPSVIFKRILASKRAAWRNGYHPQTGRRSDHSSTRRRDLADLVARCRRLLRFCPTFTLMGDGHTPVASRLPLPTAPLKRALRLLSSPTSGRRCSAPALYGDFLQCVALEAGTALPCPVLIGPRGWGHTRFIQRPSA